MSVLLELCKRFGCAENGIAAHVCFDWRRWEIEMYEMHVVGFDVLWRSCVFSYTVRLFVSLVFLQLNPAIPRDQVFVDCSSDRDAYKTAGFELLGPAAKGVKLTAPALGGVSGWFKYVTNMIRLSPTTQHHTDGTIGSGRIPEGVLQLGGTFIIDGDEIVYHWSDAVPGNHPDLNELATIASQVA
jgi:hypothetical protein